MWMPFKTKNDGGGDNDDDNNIIIPCSHLAFAFLYTPKYPFLLIYWIHLTASVV